jgi:hypothetical protein
MSTTSHIVSLLVEERSRLEAAIAALQGSHKHVHDEPPAPPKVKVSAVPKRKGLSAATRRRMAEGQKTTLCRDQRGEGCCGSGSRCGDTQGSAI